MSKSKNPPTVKTVGELMDALRDGKTKYVSLPSKPKGDSLAKRIREGRTSRSAKPPRELIDFDGLMQRCNRYYSQRLGDEVLLEAIAVVAEHKGCLIRRVRRMTFSEFNAALDEAMGTRRYGPDPNKPILYWNSTPYPLTRHNWLFLLSVWGKYNVPFADIGEGVWGDDATPAGRIRQLILRVNRQLSDYGIDLAFTVEGECVSPVADWPK